MIPRLPDNCNTLYADLQQKVLDSLAIQTGGSFVTKTIKGVTYWYFQTRQVAGHRKQIFIGRESPEILAQVERAREAKTDAAKIMEERKRLVAMLAVGGATIEKGRPAKIIDSMASAGVFDAGGILVGSFAFASYGNMLGASFNAALLRTEDIDFSIERDIQIGLARNISDDLRRADPSLKTPPQLLPSSVSFELIASDGFKVEFLTTRESASDNTTVLIEQLSVHAQPLEYMDYLIENNQPAIILHAAGIPVRVPDPARFALHKLAVSQLRPISMKTKADKDIRQASAILEILLEDAPGVILLAADALNERNDMMSNLTRRGALQLPAAIRDQVAAMIPEKVWAAPRGAPLNK